MRCVECSKELKGGSDTHTFAGYAFYLTYCAEHCPRELDGSECGKEHNDERIKEGSHELLR